MSHVSEPRSFQHNIILLCLNVDGKHKLMFSEVSDLEFLLYPKAIQPRKDANLALPMLHDLRELPQEVKPNLGCLLSPLSQSC